MDIQPQEKTELVVSKRKNLTKLEQSVNKQSLPKYWDREHISSTLENIENSKDKMFLTFLWMTGVRVSEALGVQKQDINFKNYTIRIRWLKNRKYKERNIAILPQLRNILQLYTAGLNQDNKVFEFTRQRADQIIKKYFGQDAYCHMMRHSFAVNWLVQGGQFVWLSKHLGHSRLQTTMIYLQIVPVDVGKELIKIQF